MRLNQFLAKHTDLSRRSADKAITDGRVEVNGVQAKLGDIVIDSDKLTLDGKEVTTNTRGITLILNKPEGYVCSRNGQGSKTVYDLLPADYHHLNTVGRLDKESSGLLLMTNDGNLANNLTHPSFSKQKIYLLGLNKPLTSTDESKIKKGVNIGDERLSRLDIKKHKLKTVNPSLKLRLPNLYLVTLSEGRNRQIRRTLGVLGYKVAYLHRTNFGPYKLGNLLPGQYLDINV